MVSCDNLIETADGRDSSTVDALRKRVQTPIRVAEQIVENERAEVEAERRAYTHFKERVAEVETVPASGSAQLGTPRTHAGEGSSRGCERVRHAFVETVTSVDHYEEVYGETPDEHAAAELSPEVAAGLQADTETSFTELYKTRLTAAIDSAIAGREAFLD